jgi:perosamine synthetase
MKVALGGPSLGLQETLAVVRQLRSGQLAQGQRVREFEEAFTSVSGAEFSIAVNSGTSALHIGLLASGIGPGDEVIVPSFTFAATANSVALTGAKPVFCDVEPDYFTLDPVKVRALITPRTKGIMAVHLYGQMADMSALTEVASEFGLQIFEDAAQAHGASLNGTPAGSWGVFGAFSFYPTKNMTTGEGGLISTSSASIQRSSQLLRNQGMIERYKNEVVGLNNRMTEIAAAIGLVQLQKLPSFNQKRNRNAQFLNEALSSIPGLKVPEVRPGSTHVFHQFTVLIKEGRDEVQGRLRDLGVESAVYYPTPVHKLPAYAQDLDLPVTDKLTKTCLSLPISPRNGLKEMDKVQAAIRQVLT